MGESRTGKGDRPDAPVENAETSYRVNDRRHWAHAEEEETEPAAPEPARPTVLDEFRRRAEDAESRLHEYIEAFKKREQEQEQIRLRLARDVDQKVDLRFGQVLSELLDILDDLNLALSHVKDVPQAASLAAGVAIARDRFLATLEHHGVVPIDPQASLFDPNEAEAIRVDPVESPERDNTVTETLRLGYRLGERVIRPARVAVGRYSPSRSA